MTGVKVITVGNLFAEGTRKLGEAGFASAGLDARLLLQHLLKCSHGEIISRHNDLLSCRFGDHYRELLDRRLAREPVHRITGEREFYGRSFQLSEGTLVPRPDTEILVEETLRVLSRLKRAAKVLEIGTGSGVIAVSLACEKSDASIVATDIACDALETALGNATAQGVNERIQFVQADLFEGLKGRFDVMVSNPPYIPSSDIADLDDEVRFHDPETALDGGLDGFFFFRRILDACNRFLSRGGALLVEFGIGQREELETMIGNHGFQSVSFVRDLSGIDRVLVAENFRSKG